MKCRTQVKDMPCINLLTFVASNNPAVSLHLKIAGLFSGMYALNSQTVAAVKVNYHPLVSTLFRFLPFPLPNPPTLIMQLIVCLGCLGRV